MDNILDEDLVDLYLQLRYIPNSMISRVIPDWMILIMNYNISFLS